MPGESTVRDALVAEMLGDIGRLHDSVESLKGFLPGQIEEVEERLTRVIGLLQRAGDAYRGEIVGITNNQLTATLSKIEKAGLSAQRQVHTDAAAAKLELERAVAGAMEEVKRTVKTTIQTAMASPIQDVVRTLQRSIWTNIGFCFFSGLFGGSVPVAIWAFIH